MFVVEESFVQRKSYTESLYGKHESTVDLIGAGVGVGGQGSPGPPNPLPTALQLAGLLGDRAGSGFPWGELGSLRGSRCPERS